MSPLGRLALYLTSALLVHGLLTQAYRAWIVPAHRVVELDRAFVEHQGPIDLLVVGDSHAMNAVHAPALGPRAYSVAVSGEHALKSVYRLPWLLDQGPAVKAVLLPFDAQALSSFHVERFEPEAVWGRYVPFAELGWRRAKPFDGLARALKANVFPYVGEAATWEQRLSARRAFQDEDDPLRFDGQPPRSQRRSGEAAARDHLEGHDPVDPAMVWAWRTLLADLEQRGVRAVLVSYPVTAAYSSTVQALGAKEAPLRVLNTLIRRNPILHLDFEEVFHSEPQLFYDGDHLNGQGRARFTRLLGEALVREGVLPAEYPLAPGEPPSLDWSRLDRAVEAQLREHDLPGAALRIRQGDQVLYERTFGDYTFDTEIMAGSASKWISAAAMMALVDEGLIHPQDRISQYVLSYRIADKREITLHQCLAHTSGQLARHPVINEYDWSLAQAVDLLATRPLEDPPGTRFRYGAVGYHAAARAGEIAAGQSWNDLFRQRMIEPLGLRATRYGFRGTSENPGVAGNLVTTANDFDRFLQMILNRGVFEGRRVLSEAAVAAMESGQTQGLPRDGHIPVRHLRSRHDLYGYGVWRDTVDAEGELLVSSAPGKFGFTPWIDRRQGISGVLALEARGPKPLDRIPDPAGLQYLVCDIIDTGQRRPVIRPEVNPNCRRWVQEAP